MSEVLPTTPRPEHVLPNEKIDGAIGEFGNDVRLYAQQVIAESGGFRIVQRGMRPKRIRQGV